LRNLWESLYKKKGVEGLSPKMINSIHGVLHKALENAVRWKLVSRNVCDLVSPPRLVKRGIQTLTVERARQLLEVARGHRMEAILILAITTGMRRSELLALRWQDIDFEGQSLQVRRTVDFFCRIRGIYRD
jgi:integrase